MVVKCKHYRVYMPNLITIARSIILNYLFLKPKNVIFYLRFIFSQKENLSGDKN